MSKQETEARIVRMDARQWERRELAKELLIAWIPTTQDGPQVAAGIVVEYADALLDRLDAPKDKEAGE